jgi:hypothetical protein
MPRRSWPVLLVTAYLCAASGCATFAHKPPTPADDISPRQAAAVPAVPGERYFVVIFGSQSTPKLPRYTHSWATVAKVSGCGGPGTLTVEEQTISWMPASLDIRPWSCCVEPGTNLPLHCTIEELLRHDEHIAVWGPYEVGPGLAYRFGVQKAFMESGRVGYQCVDSLGEARTGAGCNCIHALTDMDPLFGRTQYPLAYFGESASLNVVRQLHTRPIILCPEAGHGWLLPLLGLDRYPIERRQYHGRTVPYTPENWEQYVQHHEQNGSWRCGPTNCPPLASP